MTGGATDGPPPQGLLRRASLRIPVSPRHIVLSAVIAIVLIVLVGWFVHYRAGRHRREYDALMLGTLDHLLTAQEGFFYDSAHYVGSLKALPTVHVAPGVRLELANPDRRSWWGVATYRLLGGHRCVVWVGTAPASFPNEVRAPENEAKPMCFDDNMVTAAPGKRS